MSNPRNPLDKYTTYQIKHILIGFQHTIAACNYALSDGKAFCGKAGEGLKDNVSCGTAFVIINEFEDPSHLINRLEWSFDYYSPVANTSTFTMGQLQITDRSGGFFPDSLRKIAQKLGVAETHIAMLLRTFIIGKVGTEDNIITEVVPMKSLIFNMVNLTNSFSMGVPNFYTMTFMATYNTFGQLPIFSALHQTTITHKDGGLHKEIPKPEGASCSIVPRGQEDAAKTELRKRRLDKSKPMRTLKDVLEGLKEELQEQKFEHKRQLQEWMDRVRDDWIKKIEKPKQKKKDGELPLKYDLKLDDAYKSYQINNRNLPNEQPEQSQDKTGIRSLTLPPGMNIISAVEHIFKYAKKVGEDVKDGKSFKTNLSVVRECDGKYKITLGIKRYKLAKNETGGKDTGPGESAVNPLDFKFQRGGISDVDVQNINSTLNSHIEYDVLEKQIDSIEAQVVLGDREQTTYERIPTKKFVESLFSGVRTLASPKDFGMQDGSLAAMINVSLNDHVNSQTSQFNVTINGNPDLYSDLARNPLKVSNDDPDNPILYKYPEFYPMYTKLIINIKDTAHLGQNTPATEPDRYYHTYYYHISRVTSIIEGSQFTQVLKLQRTDDKT